MSLWFVIYIAGKVGGSVGPLPYDFAECQSRAVDMYRQLKPDVVTPEGLTEADVRFACEYHDARPINEVTP